MDIELMKIRDEVLQSDFENKDTWLNLIDRILNLQDRVSILEAKMEVKGLIKTS